MTRPIKRVCIHTRGCAPAPRCDLNIQDAIGFTPLMAAVSNDNLVVTRRLLRLGCAAPDAKFRLEGPGKTAEGIRAVELAQVGRCESICKLNRPINPAVLYLEFRVLLVNK